MNENLVAITEGLSLDLLFQAYTSGCFPWSGRPARWYSPDPRAIFELESIHFSRRLLRTVRSSSYRISYDRAFHEVISFCANSHSQPWLDGEIIEVYTNFHRAGYAHSVEVWDEDDALVGGLYGVQIKGMFAGESMFHRKRDASKIAFFHLVEKLRELQVELFDAQVANSHTQSFGVLEIPRDDFLDRLGRAMRAERPWSQSWEEAS